MAREIIIYCDESVKRGKYFSNFYGGALVESKHIEDVNDALNAVKAAHHLNSEVKFQKVTENYLEKYKTLLDAFFDYVADGKIKVRIMFTQNYHVPVNLDNYQLQHQYFLLYYQFIKHAFGLRYANDGKESVRLRLYFDELPDTREKARQFKNYIRSLEENRQFQAEKFLIPEDQIAEVKSHDHVVLQCLDVVLGAMQFYLNDGHREKPEGQRRRGKRTVAKEKVYRHIRERVIVFHRNFNAGISTGKPNGMIDLWQQPYRHWLFIPSEHRKDEASVKPR